MLPLQKKTSQEIKVKSELKKGHTFPRWIIYNEGSKTPTWDFINHMSAAWPVLNTGILFNTLFSMINRNYQTYVPCSLSITVVFIVKT